MTDTMIRPATPTDLAEQAAAVGAVAAAHAARHDRDGTFVTEGLAALRDAGLLALGVPAELGGMGASIAEVAGFQRVLAHSCASTALATAMHQHVVAFTAWRWRRGMPGAEATLRRVADEGIVLVSTGGADFTAPRGEAVQVEGGYRVSGRKVFASLSTEGDVLVTMFAYDDPEQGRRVLNMAVPVGAEGVTVLGDWDALGMRGTGSNQVVLEDVFVPEDKVVANRPHGVIDPPLLVIGTISMTIVGGVYLGVAEAAAEAAIAAVAGTPKAGDPMVQRQVGLMDHRLQVARWAHERAVALVGGDPAPSPELFGAVMTAKREIVLAGTEVCDLAMEIAGGPAFSKGSVIERCYRDMRAGAFHPLTPEATLGFNGRRALGLPTDG